MDQTTLPTDEAVCRDLVTRRSQGMCEWCMAPGLPLEKAHRVGRAQGGRWQASNILDLCHKCHARNHANPSLAYASGWHLRSHQNPATEPVLLTKHGVTGWAVLADDGTWEWLSL